MSIKTIVVTRCDTVITDIEEKFETEVEEWEKEGYKIIPNTFRMSHSMTMTDYDSGQCITLAIMMEK